ncbi:hypothetical protein NQ317_010315 [Molorchus minor]|uniref:Uncharacterized protein n=1 Tax=Molorchus minor TaxID=1323400 RepID=A0ABQ9J005_9CUCU|nr:hypothetical protein NQ317_010315 [Molorchus minor]
MRKVPIHSSLALLPLPLGHIKAEGTIYIKDSERLAFSDQALVMCTQTLRNQIKDVSNMTTLQIAKLLQEIFRVYQKIPDNVNVLELAIKFCQQNRPQEKHKSHPVQNQAPPLPRGPGISNCGVPPVLPAPLNVVPAQMPPLKRPTVGRPRGRPPLPKIPGQVRQARGKSPNIGGISKSYAWQKSLLDQSYAYEYLKHYQDELIKQYSQNLSLQQLTQLSQILTQGQLNNPVTASAIANQFLTQTGLLNPSGRMRPMGTAAAGIGQSPTQLMENLSHLMSSQKKIGC